MEHHWSQYSIIPLFHYAPPPADERRKLTFIMLDVAVAYNRYQFLGEEFLTWLWYVIEKNQNLIKNFDNDFVALEIGNRIVFENRRKESGERITIKGDGASLEEGILSLKKGALVTELNLVYKSVELTWQFTLKGESLNVSSLNLPSTGLPESDEDLEGFVLEKIFFYDKILKLLENIFMHFVKIRLSNRWQNKMVPKIRNWIQSA
jgi:hypothetical protein